MEEILSRLEKNFSFKQKETIGILVTSLVAGFILTFRNWGSGEEFELVVGLGNFILAGLCVFIALLIHYLAQKVIGIKKGYSSSFRQWNNGFLISIIFSFFTFGYSPLFFTGCLRFDAIKRLRVGTFRVGIKNSDLGLIAASGPIANLILTGFLAPIYLATQSTFLESLIVANLFVAIFSLIPIPTFEKVRTVEGGTTGMYLFIASRWTYILLAGSTLAYAGVIILFNYFSYFLALIIGIIITCFYYFTYENS